MTQSDRLEPDGAPFVYVVDDDRGFRTCITKLLAASDIRARPFSQPEDLLDALDELEPGVLLLDIHMPGCDGIELLQELRARDCHWPAAVMTGHGEIPLAVRAMKLGAMEFLEKPFGAEALGEVVRTGFEQLPAAAAKSAHFRAARRLVASLSPRQMQVFEGVVSGLTSKEIALRLGISHRTVESYRLDMMNKLGVHSVVDLVELKPFLSAIDDDRQ